MAHPNVDVLDWLAVIRSEYLEMPGLSLTQRQAERLWDIDHTMCRALLARLVEAKFLERTPEGTYRRAL